MLPLKRWAVVVVVLHAAPARAEDRWSLDLSAGAPKLERSGTRVVGSGVVGWEADRTRRMHLAVIATGDAAAWDFKSAQAIQQGERLQGALGLALGGRATDAVTLFGRTDAGVVTYDATTISSAAPLLDEGSTLLRAGLTLGARMLSGPHHVIGTLGAGGQRESYGSTRVAQAGQSVSVDDRTTTTLRFEGGLSARWSVWPTRLSTRFRLEGSAFRLRRDTASFRLVTRRLAATTAAETEVTRQTEGRARFFVDVDAFTFIGLCPGVYVGVDVFRAAGPSGSTSATVPSLGVGLFGL